MATRIERIITRVVTIPYKESIKHPFLGARTHHALIVVEVKASGGYTGVSFMAIQSHRQIAALENIIIDLEPRLLGLDPMRREYIYELMWGLTVDLLHEGASNIALALIDIALWDITAKRAGLPLWQLLGGFRDKVQAYASHTLWRHMDASRIETEGAALIADGHRAMKLRLGGRPIAEDVERARVLRATVGPDALIMTDALWGFQPSEAVRLAAELEAFDIAWMEDPVRDGNLAGLAHIRSKTNIPIASGERISKPAMIPQLIPCIDHAILDVHFIGGITPWLKAAAMLDVHDIPVSTHSSHEINLQLVGGIRTGGWIEHIPRREVLFKNFPKPKNGVIDLGSTPGLGLELDEDAMKFYSAAR